MTPQAFKDRMLEELLAENEEQLGELVNTYEPMVDETPNSPENEALVALGKFGCSGRTTRYEPHLTTLLEKGLRPDLTTCAYLGLMEPAADFVRQDSTAANSTNSAGVSPLHAAAELDC